MKIRHFPSIRLALSALLLAVVATAAGCSRLPDLTPASPALTAPPSRETPASPAERSPRLLEPAPSTVVSLVPGQPLRVRYQSGLTYLLIEVLRDDLIHFQYSAGGLAPSLDQPLYTTPMVAKTDYPGPSRLSDDGHGTLETAALRLQVNPATLCLTIIDESSGQDNVLTSLCPADLARPGARFTLTPEDSQNIYGLGEQYMGPVTAQGDWLGKKRWPGNLYGNAQVAFGGGSFENAEFPIMYALGSGREGYGLFLDQAQAQFWDFRVSPWKVRTNADDLRGYILTGPDLPDLRSDYMELTGRPPVPPKKVFGLWVSEWGFDNWGELEDKLSTLRANSFPVDGFVLDLQWFGGIREGSDETQMGSLTWDTTNFPDPEAEIARLRDEQGVGLFAVEEPYVGGALPAFARMESQGFLVRQCADCPATYFDGRVWWGNGGYLDYTNPAGADFWHDWKRQPLIDAGILGHWIDLGEPENYTTNDWYMGLPGLDLHSGLDNHNIYSLMWAASIARGYARNGVERRPLMLSRSGTSGIQRFGVTMWSGDLGSRLSNLAAHVNAQMHMSLSGIDYYCTDIGGFFRAALDGDLDDLYTRWFANGMAFDVPGRTHVENLCNCKETAPDRIGDVASNLANLRQRYELVPYLYSLAYRAHLYGEPVVPPLVYYYQDDPNVREVSDEKLLGRDLLVASVTNYGETERDVYLPAGRWVSYHTNEWVTSSGQTFTGVPEYVDGLFKLPMYARAGAIVPQMYVDDKTMNVLGKRTDGTRRDELILRVYADSTPTQFTLYEDDGETIAYQQGEVRTTEIAQALAGQVETVTIAPSEGSYGGAPEQRNNVLKLVVDGTRAGGVTLNGTELQEYATQAAFDAAGSGWYNAGHNLILAKSGPMDVTATKTFEVTLVPAGE